MRGASIMEFKLKIPSNEVGKLITLFNIRFPNTDYNIINHEDSDVNIEVRTLPEYEEYIYEELFEHFDGISINETLLLQKIITIKAVMISKNGIVSVIDENDNQIVKLQGKWKDKYKDIFIEMDENTTFIDERSELTNK
jgi:hypothetical protein